MYFHKFPHVANFEFATLNSPTELHTKLGKYRIKTKASTDGTFSFHVAGKRWKKNRAQTTLQIPEPNCPDCTFSTEITPEGAFHLKDADGNLLLESLPNRFFGQCGEASLFEFVREKGDLFYGMGEKWTGLEHSQKTTKFWNTDVWADFHRESFTNGRPAPDPVYVSIPYLILKRGTTWIGLLLDNPEATFISTGPKTSIAQQMELQQSETELQSIVKDGRPRDGLFRLGAESGQPGLFVLAGSSLPELTRKLQKLVGTTPRPPAWALGYHQCRWGYQSEQDLLDLDRNFRKHEIPVDGLWLDIDYMDGYRVFTFDKKHFPEPAAALEKLADAGRQVVPIIDPGVKLDPGFSTFESGKKNDVFCKTPQGENYVGLVWPGRTVFPDFSLPEARAWWSRQVAEFSAIGVPGAWLDMNDPATGPVRNEDMLFNHGKESHATYHNQYALGMAQATYEGFLQAHPNRRPFLLSRSGFTGSNRYTAIWTGDNVSNYHHLKSSIATTLNLALSGVPFNAPDCGGFGGDTTPKLLCDWYKAGFLFPLLRNHCVFHSRPQEPWAFNRQTLEIVRRYICLRYRLRPFLYHLFIEHEQRGEAILRPLFYDFNSSPRAQLEKIDDQFMVGPNILQAPFVEESQTERTVVLPKGTRWFDIHTRGWLSGGRKISVPCHRTDTPLFVRDKSILPLARIQPDEHRFDGRKIDFHIFLSQNGTAHTRYIWDDGSSFAYRNGDISAVQISARRKGTELSIDIKFDHDRQGSGDFTFTTEKSIRNVSINGTLASKVQSQGVPFGKHIGQTWAI